MANVDATASTSGETESEINDELTESSENIFLQSISELIANSEQASSVGNGSLLSIEEVSSIPQPQFGYFLPLSAIPKRLRRFLFLEFNYIFMFPGGILGTRLYEMS